MFNGPHDVLLLCLVRLWASQKSPQICDAAVRCSHLHVMRERSNLGLQARVGPEMWTTQHCTCVSRVHRTPPTQVHKQNGSEEEREPQRGTYAANNLREALPRLPSRLGTGHNPTMWPKTSRLHDYKAGFRRHWRWVKSTWF